MCVLEIDWAPLLNVSSVAGERRRTPFKHYPSRSNGAALNVVPAVQEGFHLPSMGCDASLSSAGLRQYLPFSQHPSRVPSCPFAACCSLQRAFIYLWALPFNFFWCWLMFWICTVQCCGCVCKNNMSPMRSQWEPHAEGPAWIYGLGGRGTFIRPFNIVGSVLSNSVDKEMNHCIGAAAMWDHS